MTFVKNLRWWIVRLLAVVTAMPTAADDTITRLRPDIQSRSISWENKTGEAGVGGQANDGRKGSPCVPLVAPGETVELMNVAGCGVIRHIWITAYLFDDPDPNFAPEGLRNLIVRMYWDNSPVPSVEVPFGDFFGVAHGRTVPLETAYTSIVLGRAFNSYFPMPFRSRARITITNDLPSHRPIRMIFYQVDYELHQELPNDSGYFHAAFNRVNPTEMKKDYVLLDTDEGPGVYAGCALGLRPIDPGWWGEGEMKMYFDKDDKYPTICGTGTEDYFLAAWAISPYQTPSSGCPIATPGPKDGPRNALVSMYRFHAKDPVYFKSRFKLTLQQIGRLNNQNLERKDDVCSTVYWYQAKPNVLRPPLPDAKARSEGLLNLKPEESAVLKAN